ncbi:MAG: secretin N-terminal domain-containing protein, partial [Thermoguttaceae bacterium]
KSADAPTATMTTQECPGKSFGARILWMADAVTTTASVEGKPPAPIFVIPTPNGLTISSADLEALDQFERLLSATAEGSGNGPMAVFYLKYAKAQAVAEELEKILAGASVDSEGASASGGGHKVMKTGSVTITPETRLNALLVLANRTDQETVKRLLNILDLKESPEDIAVAPKPRMIAMEHVRASDMADVLRQVYADRLVIAQGQNLMGRGAGMAMMMGGGPGGMGFGPAGMGFGPTGMGGGPGNTGGNGQNNRADQANRISIGVDTRTNSLVVAATDALFEEVNQLVQQLDLAAASQHETVRVVTLHHTSAATVEKALTAIAGDAVKTSNSNGDSRAANGNNNTPSSASPSASRGVGRRPGGSPGQQPSMGGGGPFGGNSSPFQDFGGPDPSGGPRQ